MESLGNPDEAAQYLNACLEDEDARVFLLALRDVAGARGGIKAVSRDAHFKPGEPLSHALQVRQSIAGQLGGGPDRLRPSPGRSVHCAPARQAQNRMMPQSRPTRMGVRDASTAAEFAALGATCGDSIRKLRRIFRPA